jgi:hypothetical protein
MKFVSTTFGRHDHRRRPVELRRRIVVLDLELLDRIQSGRPSYITAGVAVAERGAITVTSRLVMKRPLIGNCSIR